MAQNYDIFISYRRGPSLDWVRSQLFERLQCQHTAAGAAPQVFFDLDGIYSGISWRRRLAEALQTSRRFLPVFTSDYFDSDMCLWELERASSLDPAGKRGLVVPLLKEPQAAARVPFEYQGIQFQDTQRLDWFSRLCSALALRETAAESQKRLQVRLWVEPTSLPEARTRDIRLVPRDHAGTQFRLGARVRVGFQANQDCWVTLVDVGTSGTVSVFYPPPPGAARPVCAGQSHYFPSAEDGFDFVLSGQTGLETIRAYASCTPFHLDTLQLDAQGRRKPLSSAMTKRDIAVVASAGAIEPTEDEANASCQFEILPPV